MLKIVSAGPSGMPIGVTPNGVMQVRRIAEDSRVLGLVEIRGNALNSVNIRRIISVTCPLRRIGAIIYARDA